MSSDAISIMGTEVGNDLCSNQPLADVRPQTADDGGLAVSGGRVQPSIFGGTGRPSSDESDRRRVEFVRLIAAGEDFDVAAQKARVSPKRALRLLSHPDVRQIVAKAA